VLAAVLPFTPASAPADATTPTPVVVVPEASEALPTTAPDAAADAPAEPIEIGEAVTIERPAVEIGEAVTIERPAVEIGDAVTIERSDDVSPA
jgi:hypothetical protein